MNEQDNPKNSAISILSFYKKLHPVGKAYIPILPALPLALIGGDFFIGLILFLTCLNIINSTK